MRGPDSGETIGNLHAEVETRARHLHVLHAARLHCAEGCSGCCEDDLSVFEVEAAPIRAHHAALLGQGIPHAAGGCAFLDGSGACRIYAHRPYVCRTQGLPLRWLEERDGGPVELRDICPLNEAGEPVELLVADECFTLGPVEERLADMQYAAGNADVSASAPTRVRLRALFVTK